MAARRKKLFALVVLTCAVVFACGTLFLTWPYVPGVQLRVRSRSTLVPINQLYRALTEGGTTGSVERILSADPSAVNRKLYGATPLYWASAEGRVDLVDLLLAKGTDPNAPCEGNETPIVPAVKGRNVTILRALIQHGADVNVRDAWGVPLLQLAHDEGWTEGERLISAELQKSASRP